MSTNFAQFNASTPQSTDYFVGYRPGSPNVLQRFPCSTILGQFVASSPSQVIAGLDTTTSITPYALFNAGFKIGTDGLLDPTTFPNWTGENFMMVQVSSSPSTNFTNLQAALTTARSKTPNGAAKSAANPVIIIAPPAVIDTGASYLAFDTPFIYLFALGTGVTIRGTQSADGGAPVVISADDGTANHGSGLWFRGITFQQLYASTANTADADDHSSAIRFPQNSVNPVRNIRFDDCNFVGINIVNGGGATSGPQFDSGLEFYNCSFDHAFRGVSILTTGCVFLDCYIPSELAIGKHVTFYGTTDDQSCGLSGAQFINTDVSLYAGASIIDGIYNNITVKVADTQSSINGSAFFYNCKISFSTANSLGFTAQAVVGGTVTLLGLTIGSILVSGATVTPSGNQTIAGGSKPRFRNCTFTAPMPLAAAGTVDLFCCSLPSNWGTPANLSYARSTLADGFCAISPSGWN